MGIQVECPRCHARYNVKEEYAGVIAKCAKCNKEIAIPKTSDKNDENTERAG